MRATLWVGLALVPLIVLLRLRQAALQGLDRVLTGQAPDLFLQPLCLLALVAALAFKDWLTAPIAMGLCVASSAASLAVGAYALKKRLPPEVRAAAPEFRPLPWRDSLLPLLLATGMQTAFSQTPILLLGALKGAEAVGIYTVANGGALLIGFALQAVTPVLAPRVVSLHARGETRELQQILTKGVWASLALALPVAAGLIAVGDWYLNIFGPSFVAGRTTLVILSVGQVVSLAMGPTSWLLVLTGHERDVAAGVTVCTAVNLVLTAVLVPLWALEGAALAAAGSLVLNNLIMTTFVFKHLGIKRERPRLAATVEGIMRPDFFIVGAPKCGTTALSTYLGQHPDVFMSTPKEPNYFGADLHRTKPRITLDTYLSYFERAAGQQRVGEASTCYLCSKTAASEIRGLTPTLGSSSCSGTRWT